MTTQDTTTQRSSSNEIPPSETDLVYKFTISRRAYPKEFRNLWQLIVKTPTDTRASELIDADSLETIISRIRLIFEQDGL